MRLKKVVSYVLLLALLVWICPTCSAFAEGVYSGYCGLEGDGTNISWAFDVSTGTLTISGSGAMIDWRHQTDFDSYDPSASVEYSYTPWYSYRDQILHGVISDGITVMGNFTFGGCSNMQDVYLGKDLTNIGVGGLEGCASLTSVVVPSGVTYLGVGAFYNATSLASVSLPEGLEIIYYGAFACCESLASIEIPSTVYQINAAAFAYCSGLKSLTIPSGVKGVSSYTFYYCTSLNSVRYLGELSYINKCAFYKCTKLTKFIIPDTCTSIAEDAFGSCFRLMLSCYADSYGETFCLENISESRYTVITHDFQLYEVVEPTCSERGYTRYYCAECDSYRCGSYVDALGHSVDEWYIDIPATPENDGRLVGSCEHCGEESYKTYQYQLPGDTDLDGSLTVYDAVLLLQYLAGEGTADENVLSAADLNRNCSLDAEDSVLLLKKLAGTE